MRKIPKKLQDKFEKLSAAVCRRSSVLIFTLIGLHVKENEKYSYNVGKKFFKVKKSPGIWQWTTNIYNLKEIHAINSEITVATYGLSDGRRAKYDFMTSADIH